MQVYSDQCGGGEDHKYASYLNVQEILSLKVATENSTADNNLRTGLAHLRPLKIEKPRRTAAIIDLIVSEYSGKCINLDPIKMFSSGATQQRLQA